MNGICLTAEQTDAESPVILMINLFLLAMILVYAHWRYGKVSKVLATKYEDL
jgi:hypothetical protein